jgi:uncharacterized glyoxalase superfamily protein PhnB
MRCKAKFVALPESFDFRLASRLKGQASPGKQVQTRCLAKYAGRKPTWRIVMILNRSVPPDTVLPHVVYRSVEDALAWLGRTFGFREHYHYGEPGRPISGAQVHLGNAWIMLRRERDGEKTPLQLGACTQSLTVFVEDIEAHYQRAKSAGAKIVEDLHETEYGELQYGAEDLDGHDWLFSRHARDVSPDQWGATVV